MTWIKKILADEQTFLAGDHTRLKEVLQPGRDGFPESFSIAYAELDPGKSSLPHRLKGSAEVYLVLSGKGEMHIDEDVFWVQSGEIVYIPAGANQYILNVGTEKLAFYCVVSPPWSSENEEILLPVQ